MEKQSCKLVNLLQNMFCKSKSSTNMNSLFFFMSTQTRVLTKKQNKPPPTKMHSYVMFTEHWVQSFKGKVCINKLAKKQNQLKLKWK